MQTIRPAPVHKLMACKAFTQGCSVSPWGGAWRGPRLRARLRGMHHTQRCARGFQLVAGASAMVCVGVGWGTASCLIFPSGF